MAESTPGTSNDLFLSVRDLIVSFTDAAGKSVTVLDGINFDVRRGEVLVVMGGSGCGKSTLLNCLIGEIKPRAGSIIYFTTGAGQIDMTSADPALRDRIRRHFGILFQSGALFSSLTVGENIALPLLEHSAVDPAIIDIVVAMKLEQVSMLPHRNKYPSQLSGGQKKRVGLARATALDPELLFYDEPSAGLDPITSASIDELILDLARKLSVTTIVVTHEMDSAFRIADRMIMLEAGRVLKIGSREDFDQIRKSRSEELANDAERRIHCFLNGLTSGSGADETGMGLYEKVLIGASDINRVG